MSVKKSLGFGILSAALGISLIGGGTWAAFNDTATVNNYFASGKLDLSVGASGNKPISFDLANLKPGDNIQRIFKLNNTGTLAIKEVLLDVTAENFVDGGLISTQDEFLSQFVIDFANLDGESERWEPRNNIVKNGQILTLADLVAGPDTYLSKINTDFIATDGSNRINLAPLTTSDTTRRGIPVNPQDSDDVFIQITFKNDLTKGENGEYVQNKFMQDSIKFFFNLEATQWDGVHVDTNHGNGTVNNAVQGSADGENMPSPRTSGDANHSSEVTEVVVD